MYCWWPAQYSRTSNKQAIYHLSKRQLVNKVSIRWLDKAVKGAKRPLEWNLFYRKDGDWIAVDGGLEGDDYVLAESVNTDAFMVEALLAEGSAGGIERWLVYDSRGREIEAEPTETNLNLSRKRVYEQLSARAWAQSYLSLLRAGFREQGGVGYHLAAYPNEYVNWISPQSGPTVMEPYSFGAAKSGLVAMLADGHEDVTLSKEEMDKLCCWIDLAVPYCGEYPESSIWTDEDIRYYERHVADRLRLSRLEILE